MEDDYFFRNDFTAQHAVGKPRALGTEAQRNPLPLVLWAILVRQGELFLDLYLECLMRQTYPKERICVYVRTNDNADKTLDIIRAWADRTKGSFNNIVIDDRDLADDPRLHKHHEWNEDRLQILGELRNESLAMTTKLGCDYFFVADVDNFVMPNTLSELVALQLPIVAPLLRGTNPRGFWSNFFADVNEYGHHVETKKYFTILTRVITGVIEVPLVHCTYLVRADVIGELSYTSPKGGFEFVNFANSARRAGLQQCIDNRQLYGYNVDVNPNDSGARVVIARVRNLIRAGE